MPVPTQRYYVCDLVTGQVLDELPLSGADTITSIIQREDSVTFNLPTADDRCPNNWRESVIAGKSMIALTLNEEPTAGWVIEDVILGGANAQIAVVSLECCLRRTYVGDIDGSIDAAAGMAQVASQLPDRFGFDIDFTETGQTIDLSYAKSEDRKVLDALAELATADGAPEWRIALSWADAERAVFRKLLLIAPRIGQDRPDVVFDLDAHGRGNIESYTRSAGGFGEGKGATMLIGVSEGSGDARPMTEPIYAPSVAAGWPVWEERVNMTGLATGTVDQETAALESRTRALLAQRAAGARTVSVVTGADAPAPGVDYGHGDTVRVEIAPQGKRDPEGITTTVRVLGWKIDSKSGQTTLIAWEDTDTTGGTS